MPSSVAIGRAIRRVAICGEQCAYIDIRSREERGRKTGII